MRADAIRSEVAAVRIDPGPLRMMEDGGSAEHAGRLLAQARAVRRWVVAMSGHARTGHVGSSLSAVDLLVALYFGALRLDPSRPDWRGRDRFILSKGHAAAALYGVLAARGFFPPEDCWTYLRDGSAFTAHVNVQVPGVELATGSLGHGLPVALGLALAARQEQASWRAFALVSDGECNEGSTWEAALAAGALGLENLTVLVDYNKMQALGPTHEVLELEPFSDKWRSFGWGVREVDGHDLEAVGRVLQDLPCERGQPSVVIAHTVLGKGVSFMEDRLPWHYLAPTDEQVAAALQELA